MKTDQLSSRLVALSAALALVLFGGCSDISGSDRTPGGSGDANITFQIVVEEADSDGVSGTDGAGNTLSADSLFLVVNQVEFKRATADDCVDSTTVDDGDDCAELPTGQGGTVQQSVVVLPVGRGATAPRFLAPPGTYDEVQFDFHVLQSGDPVDDQILINFQELESGVSTRVDGSFDPVDGSAEAFTFWSDISGEVEVPIEQPVTVGANENLTIQLQIDLIAWFRDSSGDFIDPRRASIGPREENPDLDPEARATVEANIPESFDAEGRITG